MMKKLAKETNVKLRRVTMIIAKEHWIKVTCENVGENFEEMTKSKKWGKLKDF
jgi:hypothetical protein